MKQVVNSIKLLLSASILVSSVNAQAQEVSNIEFSCDEVIITLDDSPTSEVVCEDESEQASIARWRKYSFEFANLWYAMAEATGNDPDAAYEDAFAHTSEYRVEIADAAARLCPYDSVRIVQIAGGYVAQCVDNVGAHVGYASLNGMKVSQ